MAEEKTVTQDEADEDVDHLDDIEDGAGCVEIWEHLSNDE